MERSDLLLYSCGRKTDEKKQQWKTKQRSVLGSSLPNEFNVPKGNHYQINCNNINELLSNIFFFKHNSNVTEKVFKIQVFKPNHRNYRLYSDCSHHNLNCKFSVDTLTIFSRKIYSEKYIIFIDST